MNWGPSGVRLKGTENFLGDKGVRVTSGEKELSEVSGVGVEVIRVVVDKLLLGFP